MINAELEASHAAVSRGFEVLKFDQATLEKITLPECETVEHSDLVSVRFARFGNQDAPHQIIETAPYLTSIEDPHYKIRLFVQQKLLGENVSVIGVQPFDPKHADLSGPERKKVANGNFSPISDRILRVAEHLGIERAFAYGQSMGADVSTQLTYDATNDANRGTLAIDALGALEPARVESRGPIKVAKAMAKSGKLLFKNVWDSDLPALYEAWDIDPEGDFDKQKKAFDSAVNKGGTKYMLASLGSNIALTRGFGTSESRRQLNAIVREGKTFVMLGRQSLSEVCTSEFVDHMQNRHQDRPNFDSYTDEGDHSDDDNPVRSAGRLRHFVAKASADKS